MEVSFEFFSTSETILLYYSERNSHYNSIYQEAAEKFKIIHRGKKEKKIAYTIITVRSQEMTQCIFVMMCANEEEVL